MGSPDSFETSQLPNPDIPSPKFNNHYQHCFCLYKVLADPSFFDVSVRYSLDSLNLTLLSRNKSSRLLQPSCSASILESTDGLWFIVECRRWVLFVMDVSLRSEVSPVLRLPSRDYPNSL